MSELAAVVKNGAEDMAKGGEKAGKAIAEHFENIGSELENAVTRYRGVEQDGEKEFKAIVDSGAKDAETIATDTGRAAQNTAKTAASDAESLSAKTEHEAAEDAHVDGEGGASDDPVDVVTGQMFMAQTDLSLEGLLPLLLERQNNSGYTHGRWFGSTWSSTLDQRVEIDDDGIHYAAPDGRILHFPVPTVHGQRVLPSHGPRWALVWDRGANRDEIRIEQAELGRTLIFPPGPTPEVCRPLSAVVDGGGNRITFVYDVDGVPTDIYHSGGYHVLIGSIETRGGTRVSTIRLADPAGSATHPVREFRYDMAGRLVSTYHPDSSLPLTFEYDEHDRITRWTDRNGHGYLYVYGADGRVERGEGTSGFLNASFDYDLTLRTTTLTDALGIARVFHWNERLQTVRSVDPLGNATVIEKDKYGEILALTDALGHTARFEHNAHGDPLSIVQADGARLSYAYDDQRRLRELTKADGTVWRYAYGAHGQVVEVTDPVGSTARYDRDDHGRITRVVDELGRETIVRCDGAGLPVELVGATGETTRFTRDAFGRISVFVEPSGRTTTFERNAAGQLLRASTSDAAVETWTYDPEGNLLSHTTASGAVTRYAYGPFDSLIARTDPDGAEYRFIYDANLQLTEVTGPTGLQWTYRYDDAGRVIGETDFDGAETAYELDALGRPLSRTNAVGQRIAYRWDAVGRMLEKQLDDAVYQYTYDPRGLMRSASAPGNALEFVRDQLGRVTAEVLNGRSLLNEFDVAGQRIGRTTPTGVTSRWSYNAAGKPADLTGSAGAVQFAYDEAGREISRRLGPNAILSRSYDAAGRLATQGIWAYDAPGAAALDPASSPRQLQSRVFSYRPDGAPERIQDALRGTRAYALDALGRTTAVLGDGPGEQYAYDPLGNLTRATPFGDDQGADEAREYAGTRMRRSGRTVYEHDAAGRLIRKSRRTLSGQIREWTFIWDAEDRLTGTTTPNGDRWAYYYDALGRRIAKTHLDPDGRPHETVHYTWDAARLVEEIRTSDEGVATSLTWDHEPGTAAPIAQTRRTWATNAPQAAIDEEFHAIVTDLVGTPQELVSADGRLAWWTQRSLWGSTITAPESTTECPLRFPGQYHDAETGLDYNLSRYYDTEAAAYVSPDPLGMAPGPHPRAYVANPLTSSDPLGLAACPLRQYADSQRPKAGRNGVQYAAEYTSPSGAKYYGVNKHGLEMPDELKQVLEDNQLTHHGGCAEIEALTHAYEAEGASALRGGSMKAMKVFSTASAKAAEHGDPAYPCRRACQPLLTTLGITF